MTTYDVGVSQTLNLSSSTAKQDTAIKQTLDVEQVATVQRPDVTQSINFDQTVAHNYHTADCVDFLSFVQAVRCNHFNVDVLDSVAFSHTVSTTGSTLSNPKKASDFLTFVEQITVSKTLNKSIQQTLGLQQACDRYILGYVTINGRRYRSDQW